MMEERDRVLKSICMVMYSATHGLFADLKGPSLNDFSLQTGVSVSEVSAIITAESGGTLCGSIMCKNLAIMSQSDR